MIIINILNNKLQQETIVNVYQKENIAIGLYKLVVVEETCSMSFLVIIESYSATYYKKQKQLLSKIEE